MFGFFKIILVPMKKKWKPDAWVHFPVALNSINTSIIV